MIKSNDWVRGLIAGIAGGAAWFIGILLFFGPAQIILTNPDLQSAKMLVVFTEEPLPRASEAPWILIAGLFTIGALWGMVYVYLIPAFKGSWWKRGLRFGAIGWILMVPWFQFYLPWNVLLEPALLVLLEMTCWSGVLLLTGLTIAGVEQKLDKKNVI